MLRDIDAKNGVIVLAGIDHFAVGVLEVLFFQIVDLDALDRRDPHIVVAVVDQNLTLVRVGLFLGVDDVSAQCHDKRDRQKKDHNAFYNIFYLSAHLTTYLFL